MLSSYSTSASSTSAAHLSAQDAHSAAGAGEGRWSSPRWPETGRWSAGRRPELERRWALECQALAGNGRWSASRPLALAGTGHWSAGQKPMNRPFLLPNHSKPTPACTRNPLRSTTMLLQPCSHSSDHRFLSFRTESFVLVWRWPALALERRASAGTGAALGAAVH